MAGIFRVELHYEWNELAEAEALLTRHRPLIEECGLVVHDIACKLHVARLAAARSQIDEALAVLERAERQGVKNRYRRLSATALNDRVRLLVLRGETTLARHVLAARGISEDWARRPEARRQACELEHVALARLLIAENRPEAAIQLLDPLAERVRHEGRLRRLAQIRAVTAIAAYRTGDGLAMLAAIVDAVDICRRQGALRALIDEGCTSATCCSLAARRCQAGGHEARWQPIWIGSSGPGPRRMRPKGGASRRGPGSARRNPTWRGC